MNFSLAYEKSWLKVAKWTACSLSKVQYLCANKQIHANANCVDCTVKQHRQVILQWHTHSNVNTMCQMISCAHKVKCQHNKYVDKVEYVEFHLLFGSAVAVHTLCLLYRNLDSVFTYQKLIFVTNHTSFSFTQMNAAMKLLHIFFLF